MGVFVLFKFEIYLQNKQISYLQFYSYALYTCVLKKTYWCVIWK